MRNEALQMKKFKRGHRLSSCLAQLEDLQARKERAHLCKDAIDRMYDRYLAQILWCQRHLTEAAAALSCR